MKTYPQMSDYQRCYLDYIAKHPGCCIMDVVRACRVNYQAGHKWIYDGVHRLEQQGVIDIDKNKGRTSLTVVEE